MRGLSFEISNPKGVPLQKILTSVFVKGFYWYVVGDQNDTWDKNMDHLLFDHVAYDNASFFETIKQDHFVIFLKLQAYFPHNGYDKILSYDDFEKSECQLLLLIHDCYYVDIYVKDQTMIEEIYQCAISSGYQNVRYIEEDNDARTKMNVI